MKFTALSSSLWLFFILSNCFPYNGASFTTSPVIRNNNSQRINNDDIQDETMFKSGCGHLKTHSIMKKYKSSKLWEVLTDTTSIACSPQVLTDAATLHAISKEIGESKHPGNERSSDDPDIAVFEPWGADYTTSSRTQKNIKSAASQRASPIVRASSVLKTLLNTDCTKCNPSNLVCALTLSAKIVPKHAQRRHEFRDLLHRALDILNLLVENEQLNTRQLANAVWAIAKHYASDEGIFPPSFRRKNHGSVGYAANEGMSSSSIVSIAEKWNLKEEGKYEKGERALCTVEMIARQLMDVTITTNGTVSSSDSGISTNNRTRSMNQVEMSMVFWAYAILFPRHVPAGWELPPRVGLMETTMSTSASTSRGKRLDGLVVDDDDIETITFESLQDSKNYNAIRENIQPTSIVDKLFDALASDMTQPIDNSGVTMLHQCQWKELSTIAWSCANRGYCQSPHAQVLIMNLTKVAISRITEKKDNNMKDILPRDAAEIAWALGTMQSDCYNLSDSLEQYVKVVDENMIDKSLDRPLETWKSADCVQMAIALGHGSLDQRYLLEQIYKEALISMNEVLKHVKKGTFHSTDKPFLVFELVALLWVQARLYLNGDCGSIFDEFSEKVPEIILYRMHMLNESEEKSPHDVQTAFAKINLGSQEQANLVWSLTVLEKFHSKFAVDLLCHIFSSFSKSCKEGNPIRLEHAHQLWQSIVILQHECPEALRNVDPETFTFLKNTWNQEKARQKSSSARHRALSQTLNLMGVKHYNEHDEDVDMALVLKMDSKWTHSAEHTSSKNSDNRQRVAVEFDGPSHFTKIAKSDNGQKPKPPRALGHTVLKYKLLKKLGWTIVRIPFYEFDRIPFWASMERQRYIQRKLKTHANLRFSGMDVSEYKAPVPNRNSRFD